MISFSEMRGIRELLRATPAVRFTRMLLQLGAHDGRRVAFIEHVFYLRRADDGRIMGSPDGARERADRLDIGFDERPDLKRRRRAVHRGRVRPAGAS